MSVSERIVRGYTIKPFENLRYANLSGADLQYADLSSANLRYANLSSADLRYANLTNANLRYADLTGADLTGADLSGADLQYADLRYANLSGADLSNANLRYANLYGANLGDWERGPNGYARKKTVDAIPETEQIEDVVVVSTTRQIGDFSREPAEHLTSETGAQKGMRITRHDLLPPAALNEIAAVYGYGERKYPAGEDGPNWLRGMPFSWNMRAALDHISLWQEGVDFDTEDGCSHLAHATWHLLAILEFQARGIGTDDRPYKRA